MADPRRRPGTITNGNLAYDLDALVRERNLEEAGKVHEHERVARPRPQPRRKPVAQPQPKASPMLVSGIVILATMVLALIMGYVRMTTISGDVARLKNELAVLNDENVSLMTRYEQTFDLATIKETAESAGMNKPTSAQIEYVDLSGSDVAVVYQASGDGLLGELLHGVGESLTALVEYFR